MLIFRNLPNKNHFYYCDFTLIGCVAIGNSQYELFMICTVVRILQLSVNEVIVASHYVTII